MHPYLNEVRKALDQIFKALNYYNEILENYNAPVVITDISEEKDLDFITDRWIQENTDRINENIEKERKYFAHINSKFILCGTLLQIAYMGIKLFGAPHDIPNDFKHVAPKTKYSKNTFKRFCCGRKIRGISIGLIIYAGRNQYNHYDESTLSLTNQKIFEILSKNHGLPNCQNINDPSFDLSNKTLTIYASNIISIMGWDKGSNFYQDMNSLLRDRE